MLPSLFWSKWSKMTRSSCLARKTPSWDMNSSNSSFWSTPSWLRSKLYTSRSLSVSGQVRESFEQPFANNQLLRYLNWAQREKVQDHFDLFSFSQTLKLSLAHFKDWTESTQMIEMNLSRRLKVVHIAWITYEEDVLELSHVVYALGEELSLHLVDDLVHTVSPVGHDRYFCREILPKKFSCLSKTLSNCFD